MTIGGGRGGWRGWRIYIYIYNINAYECILIFFKKGRNKVEKKVEKMDERDKDMLGNMLKHDVLKPTK